jgi:hypothetical protein
MRASSLALGAALLAHNAFGADFSGDWNIRSSVGDNPVSIRCTIVQRGEVLTGSCQPQNFDPSAVTGTVSGSAATWGYEVVFNGTTNRVVYEASLGADGTLNGTLHLGAMPTAFTASRL